MAAFVVRISFSVATEVLRSGNDRGICMRQPLSDHSPPGYPNQRSFSGKYEASGQHC